MINGLTAEEEQKARKEAAEKLGWTSINLTCINFGPADLFGYPPGKEPSKAASYHERDLALRRVPYLISPSDPAAEPDVPFKVDPNDPSVITPKRCFNFEQYMIRLWCQKFSKETPTAPTIPTTNVRIHCAKLILEEFNEYLQATGLRLTFVEGQGFEVVENGAFFGTVPHPDLVDMFDATLDLKWVVNFAEVLHGISAEQSDHGFAALIDSNFSKLWTANEVMKARNEDVLCGSTGPVRILSDWRVVHTPESAHHGEGHTNDSKCFVVLRPPDWKIIKSPSYTPLDVRPILFPASAEEKQS